MAKPPQKDGFDTVIDFFIGAIFSDIGIGFIFLRAARSLRFVWNGHVFLICLLAGALIGGSLAALYRNQFWSNYDSYSIIPPMEESVSKEQKRILWGLLILGVASLGLLFLWV